MLSVLFDKNLVYTKSISLIVIVIMQTIIARFGTEISLGLNKEITESYINFKAIKIIDKLINKENMYSAFPCPKL